MPTNTFIAFCSISFRASHVWNKGRCTSTQRLSKWAWRCSGFSLYVIFNLLVFFTCKVFMTLNKFNLRTHQHPVTTRLVVLSNRLQLWKNWQKRRTPRRTVMGTTERRRVSFQNTQKIGNWVLKIDSLNFVTEWQDGPSQVWRTVTDPWWKFGSLNSATTCRTDRRRHDGPSQVAQIPGRVEFLVKF